MGKVAKNVEEAIAMARASLKSTEGIQVLSDGRAALYEWYKYADVCQRLKIIDLDKRLALLMSERINAKEGKNDEKNHTNDTCPLGAGGRGIR